MVTQSILLKKENTNGTVVGVPRVWKAMKLVSIFSLAFMMFIGCGEPNLDNPKVVERIFAQAIDFHNLQFRETPSGEDIGYAPNQNQPYTGWVKASGADFSEFVIHRALTQFQKGEANGVYISWFRNGQIAEKGTTKNGERNGSWTRWHENGQKYEKGTFKNNEKYGLWIQWDEDGKEVSRETY